MRHRVAIDRRPSWLQTQLATEQPERIANVNSAFLKTAATPLLVSAALLLALALPSASEATIRQAAYSEDSGRFPSVSAYPSTGRPSALSYELTANPPMPVRLHWSITCRANSRSIGSEATLNPVSPPLTGSVPLTIDEPDSCDWSVSAEYVDFEQTGTLTLTLFAEIRPEWTRCAAPSWSRDASLKVRDIPCGRAGRIVKQALQKRPEDGNFLRVAPFYCSRARIKAGTGARVNCHDTPELIRFEGAVRLRSAWLRGVRR